MGLKSIQEVVEAQKIAGESWDTSSWHENTLQAKVDCHEPIQVVRMLLWSQYVVKKPIRQEVTRRVKKAKLYSSDK